MLLCVSFNVTHLAPSLAKRMTTISSSSHHGVGGAVKDNQRPRTPGVPTRADPIWRRSSNHAYAKSAPRPHSLLFHHLADRPTIQAHPYHLSRPRQRRAQANPLVYRCSSNSSNPCYTRSKPIDMTNLKKKSHRHP